MQASGAGKKPLFIIAVLWAVLGLSGCTDSDSDMRSDIANAEEAGTEFALQSAPYTRSEMNESLPDFEFTDMLGNRLSNEEIKGKVTLVNFWATWCGPCIIEIPEFVVLYDDWQDRPFEIIGVSMDDDGFDLVRPFAEDLVMNYPVVIDDGTLAEQFGGVYGLPTTFLVDEHGTITDRFIGIFPVEELREEMDAMIQRAGSN